MCRLPLSGVTSRLLLLILCTGQQAFSQEKPSGPRDRYGAPLPAGAVARIESALLREKRNSNVCQLAMSPDGKVLVSDEHNGGEIRLWNPVTGEQLPQFQPPMEGEGHLAFSPDGTRLAAIPRHRGPVRIYDPATGKEVRQLAGQEDIVWGMVFSPDGRMLAAENAASFPCCAAAA
jgi:WD40 repeat protein